MKISNANNNIRGAMIKEMLMEEGVPFSPLGSGTNRLGILIDGYAVKIALDEDGQIDNKREYLYSEVLQPYAVKVYECSAEGHIMVCEYITIFSLSDIYDPRIVSKMKAILEDITTNYFVGDIGITDKNFVNWGKRNDDSLCILDFAYIYDVKYNLFSCPKCGPEYMVRYDAKYVDLICPVCGEKYTFANIRRKITREEQRNEIGDIKLLGYNLRLSEEVVEFVEEFESKFKEGKKKVKDKTNSVKRIIKDHKKLKKMMVEEEFDYWDQDY
jgi:predicted RNA-binding Zn-ribbon protein involved in translation (DUF1610 family)